MGQIFLDFRPEITSIHLESLERALPGVKGNDYVTVIIEQQNDLSENKVLQILKQNGFNIKSKSSFEGELAITAERLLH
ncbi:MAG: hypothetical protein ACOX4L_07070 [Bacillota bacterium]